MKEVNAGSLFHYTKKIDVLLKILKKGIRYSYSAEEFDNDIIFAYEDGGKLNKCRLLEDANTPRVIAMPMVSFCDIPLSRIAKHQERYGKYCIGLDKTAFLKYWKGRISPVTYYPNPEFRDYFLYLSDLLNDVGNFDGDALSEYCHQLTKGKNVNDGVGVLAKDEKAMAFIKQEDVFIKLKCFATQVLAVTKPMVSSKGAANYDEREWRAYTLDGLNGDDWGKWEILNKDNNNDRVSLLNNRLTNEKKAYIKIEPIYVSNAISHIIVETEKEVPEIISAILKLPTLFGYKQPEEKRQLLISKVTSFERIEKDY